MIFYIVTMVGFWTCFVHQIWGWGGETAFTLFQRDLPSLNEDNFAILHKRFPETGVSLHRLQQVEFMGIDKADAAQIWAWSED